MLITVVREYRIKTVEKKLSQFQNVSTCFNFSNRTKSTQEFREAKDKLDFTEKQLNLLTSEIKHKILQMVEEVEKKVSLALLEEIKRLAILVDEFDRPFHPDAMFLNIYKKVRMTNSVK